MFRRSWIAALALAAVVAMPSLSDAGWWHGGGYGWGGYGWGGGVHTYQSVYPQYTYGIYGGYHSPYHHFHSSQWSYRNSLYNMYRPYAYAGYMPYVYSRAHAFRPYYTGSSYYAGYSPLSVYGGSYFYGSPSVGGFGVYGYNGADWAVPRFVEPYPVAGYGYDFYQRPNFYDTYYDTCCLPDVAPQVTGSCCGVYPAYTAGCASPITSSDYSSCGCAAPVLDTCAVYGGYGYGVDF